MLKDKRIQSGKTARMHRDCAGVPVIGAAVLRLLSMERSIEENGHLLRLANFISARDP